MRAISDSSETTVRDLQGQSGRNGLHGGARAFEGEHRQK